MSESELEYDPEGEREKAAREVGRRRVLEAAGLAVSPLADGEVEALRPRPRPRPYIPSSIVTEEHGHEHGRHVPIAPALSAVTRSKSGSSSGSMSAPSESPGRKRRPAPAAPRRGLTHLSTKGLPPNPTLDFPDTDPSPDVLFGSFDTTAADKDDDAVRDGQVMLGTGHLKTRSEGSVIHLDDAFGRYETFKKMQASHGHGHGHSPLFPHAYAT